MNASNDMEELIKRIYRPSVLYFPKELFPDLSSETEKTLKEFKFFEEMGIVKANGKTGALKTSVNALEIYKKDNILEANIFQLLEMKERLGNESFGFLLDKYITSVNAWVFIYNWLHEHFDKQFTESSINEKSLFKYQCTILDQHLAMLNQKFIFSLKTQSSTNIIDVLTKHTPLPFDKSIFNNLSGSAKKEVVTKKTRSSKKQELLSDHEADAFLLKSVFNVKM